MGMKPMCKLFERTKKLESFMSAMLAKAGKGASLAKGWTGKKQKQVKSRAETKQDDMESKIISMHNKDLLICNACCPRTGMYYLEEKRFQKHFVKDEHDFPARENVCDFVLHEASKPGGLVETGSSSD
jgi:hypothetical protein